MGTTLIERRKKGADLAKCTDQERMFCLYLMADEQFRPTEAARKAKYRNPKVAANRLMKRPRIKAILGKFMREREERCEIEADDVIGILRDTLALRPTDYFRPSANGKWLIDDLDALPDWVKRLIKKMKLRTIETEQGTYSEFEVELMDKDKALDLAMKHFGLLAPDQLNLNVGRQRDFLAELAKPLPPNPIEERLEQERKLLEHKERNGAEEGNG